MIGRSVAEAVSRLFREMGVTRATQHSMSTYNTCIMLLVAVPPICIAYLVRHSCSFVPLTTFPCSVYFTQPLNLLNLLWFLHVDVTFYIISLIQGSTWLIDPYWTLAPPMLAAFWLTHPASAPVNARQVISTALLLLWAARLTHSYLRRENWIVGHQEDWRYADMKSQFGKWWPLMQVFAVYVMQHLMLVGLMLPWYAISTASTPWQHLDTAAVLVSASGIGIAALADNSLHAFVSSDRKGRPEVLREGLWNISRHPNHLGEQLWWWGAGLFAVAVGQPWQLIGTAFNSLCMWKVMAMVEERMLRKPDRKPAYLQYQKDVAFCIPYVHIPYVH